MTGMAGLGLPIILLYCDHCNANWSVLLPSRHINRSLRRVWVVVRSPVVDQQGRGVARPILAEAGHRSVKRERIIVDINLSESGEFSVSLIVPTTTTWAAQTNKHVKSATSKGSQARLRVIGKSMNITLALDLLGNQNQYSPSPSLPPCLCVC